LARGPACAGVTGRPLSLSARRGPRRAIAANGRLSVQAQAGSLVLLAEGAVSVSSTEERGEVLAKEKVVLRAGQTEVVVEGGDISFACPGTFTVKAGLVQFAGG